MAIAQADDTYPCASLYVGNLSPDVTEAMLLEKFSQVGPILSIRVCRNTVTNRSLGYAYVDFETPTDAERALDTMDLRPFNGRQCSILWSQHDPSIYVKNFGKDFDTETKGYL